MILLLCSIIKFNQAQNVGINSTGTAPDNSAMLDVVSTDKGMLVPRVNIIDLNTAAPVTAPATSLLVYNTNTTSGVGYYFWDGTKWINLKDANSNADEDWYKVGGTTAPININDNIFTQGKVSVGMQNTTGATLSLKGVNYDDAVAIDANSDGNFVFMGEYNEGIAFGLASGTISSGNSQMLIGNTGNVGIGNVAPISKLQVQSISNVNAFRVERGLTTIFDILNTGQIGIGTSLLTTNNKDVVFNLQSINASGTPTNDVYYVAASNSSPIRQIYGNDGANFGTFNFNNSTLAADKKFTFTINSFADTILSVVGDGNVGIGTATPSEKLEVMNGYVKVDEGVQFGTNGLLRESSDIVRLRNIDNSKRMSLHFGGSLSSVNGSYINMSGSNYVPNPSLMHFSGSKFVMTGGNLGIGTLTTQNITSPLQVIGILEFTDNAAALAGGLTIGAFYRTGDLLKVVH